MSFPGNSDWCWASHRAGKISAKFPCSVPNATRQKEGGESDTIRWGAQESHPVGSPCQKGQARFECPGGVCEYAVHGGALVPTRSPHVGTHPRVREEPWLHGNHAHGWSFPPGSKGASTCADFNYVPNDFVPHLLTLIVYKDVRNQTSLEKKPTKRAQLPDCSV